MNIVLTTGRNCGSAKWIKEKAETKRTKETGERCMYVLKKLIQL